MRVDLVRAADVRCHAMAELRPAAGVTAVVGPNGSGKTSLIEAVHLGVRGIGLRPAGDARMVRDGADRLGVPLTQLGQFSGAGGRLSARIAGADHSVQLVADRHPGDAETQRFVAATKDRLAALSAAVPAAENMPGPRRRAAQASISEQLDGIEADLLNRLGVL